MKFAKEINEINITIKEFNKYLIKDYEIPCFDLKSGFENNSIVKIIHKEWDSFGFPNNGTRGVYFVFGYSEISNDKNGIYIGKASLSSTTSNRLYSHLNPSRTKEHFTMNYGSENYIIEYMASIDLDKLKISFIAPALEEYLITSLKEKINLINGTGN